MRKIEDVILKDGRSLKEVLELHKKWLKEEKGGEKADLSYEDLSDVDFSDLNLRYAILSYANLENANLIGVNLIGANLSDANLIGANLIGVCLSYANLENANLKGVNLTDANLTRANLRYANLEDANLIGANLISANLSDANLRYVFLTGANLTDANLKYAKLTGANLTDIKYNNTTSFFALQCPEKGSFIGYKKADNKIVELLITEDSKRSSATTRKCRCSKAKVLSITSLDGKEEYTDAASDYDLKFIYKVGEIVEVEDFDEDRWNECSTGIHFFITRDEAVMY